MIIYFRQRSVADVSVLKAEMILSTATQTVSTLPNTSNLYGSMIHIIMDIIYIGLLVIDKKLNYFLIFMRNLE